MERKKMIEMIGNRLADEIVKIAEEKQIDVNMILDGFNQMIDIKIISPDIAADEVAAARDKEEDLDNLKEDVLKYVMDLLKEEYQTPKFLN